MHIPGFVRMSLWRFYVNFPVIITCVLMNLFTFSSFSFLLQAGEGGVSKLTGNVHIPSQ